MQHFKRFLRRTWSAGVAVSVTLVVGCGGGGDAAESAMPARASAESASTGADAVGGACDLSISPPDTASGGTGPSATYGSHCVFPALNPTRLFVFFGASKAEPSTYQMIGSAAAAAGVAAIGLAYPNYPSGGFTLDGACQKAPLDALCYEKIRSEVLNGTDSSSLITVGVADSVTNRIVRLLVYLRDGNGSTVPPRPASENWATFLGAGNTITWSKLRVGGLSQGAGMAGYIGKKKSVDRVCMLSGPADWDYTNGANGASPSWLTDPGATPATKFYGLSHLMDMVVPYSTRVDPNWTALAMTGPTTSVDSATSGPPYSASLPASAPTNGAHRMTTQVAVSPPVSGSYHTSLAADYNTPISGTSGPYFKPIWAYGCY